MLRKVVELTLAYEKQYRKKVHNVKLTMKAHLAYLVNDIDVHVGKKAFTVVCIFE